MPYDFFSTSSITVGVWRMQAIPVVTLKRGNTTPPEPLFTNLQLIPGSAAMQTC